MVLGFILFYFGGGSDVLVGGGYRFFLESQILNSLIFFTFASIPLSTKCTINMSTITLTPLQLENYFSYIYLYLMCYSLYSIVFYVGFIFKNFYIFNGFHINKKIII